MLYISQNLRKNILKAITGREKLVISGVWVGLLTTLPTGANPSGTEVTATTANKYARVKVSELNNQANDYALVSSLWGDPFDLVGTMPEDIFITNTSDIVFPLLPAGETWGTVEGIGAYDAATSGSLLWWVPLNAAQAIQAGTVTIIRANGIELQVPDALYL